MDFYLIQKKLKFNIFVNTHLCLSTAPVNHSILYLHTIYQIFKKRLQIYLSKMYVSFKSLTAEFRRKIELGTKPSCMGN